MITDTDIKKLKTVFATKEDLDKYATKDALAALDKKVDVIAGYVMNHEVKLNEINQKLDDIGDVNAMFKQIMVALDIKTKTDEGFKSEQVAVHHKLNRHESWIGVLSTGTGIALPA